MIRGHYEAINEWFECLGSMFGSKPQAQPKQSIKDQLLRLAISQRRKK